VFQPLARKVRMKKFIFCYAPYFENCLAITQFVAVDKRNSETFHSFLITVNFTLLAANFTESFVLQAH
jgi:hypothetical protein